jgi:hypothetical protein
MCGGDEEAPLRFAGIGMREVEMCSGFTDAIKFSFRERFQADARVGKAFASGKNHRAAVTCSQASSTRLE